MKLNKFFIAGSVLAVSLSLGSCVNDLDLTPTSPDDITANKFPSNPEIYMREVMADVYLNISTFGPNGNNILTSMDGGMSTFQRAVFNCEEIPSDEASWLPMTDAIPWTFQFGEITAIDPVVMGTYSRLMVISTLCNNFIQTDFGLKTESERALRDEFVRQCKILRSGMYFYLISEFGNVPYNDENVYASEVAPQLDKDFATGRRLVTERVVETLEEIVEWYKQNDPQNNPPYGYVGLDVAEALLVKFYLNYGVFTGTEAWDKCYEHAKAVIGRRGNGGFVASDGTATGLAKNYFQNFCPNNTDQNEIIWRIVSQNADTNNGVGVLNWANGGFMMMGWIGDDKDRYNSGNAWKCMVARRSFVEVFDWNEDYTSSPDDRVSWWGTAAEGGYVLDNVNLEFADYGRNGYTAVKYTNWYINDDGSTDPSKSPGKITDQCMDYGMIRLAEIYLSAAEALLKGAGSASEAEKYVNFIRERAHLDPITGITEANLQDERQRELYTECVRRTDLIRYGKWISGYNWDWKYHVKEGADFPARFTVYPLPQTVVTMNGYQQNPDY